jgi:hypothetical protein
MPGGGSPTLQFRVVPRARGAAEGRAAHLHATVGAGSAGEVTNISVQQL